MSCNIEVLTTIGEYEPSDFKDAGEKRRIVMELKEALTDSLRDSYQGQIDYFKEFEPDMSETSTDLILGCERPDELKKIATNWNAEIKEQCAKQFEYLEMEMKKRGYESLSSFIREAADENNHLSVQYPASLYELRKALGAFDDHYSYGCIICQRK